MPKGSEHDIDPISGYCMKCGSHEELIITEDLKCAVGDNITGFSHRRVWQIESQKSKAQNDPPKAG